MENDKKPDKMTSICVRMPFSLKEKLDAKCKAENIAVGVKMRDLAAQYVDDPNSKQSEQSIAAAYEEIKKRYRVVEGNIARLENKLYPNGSNQYMAPITRKAASLCGAKPCGISISTILDSIVANEDLMTKLFHYEANFIEDKIEPPAWEDFLQYLEEAISERSIKKQLADIRLKLHGIDEIVNRPILEKEASEELQEVNSESAKKPIETVAPTNSYPEESNNANINSEGSSEEENTDSTDVESDSEFEGDNSES